MRLRARNSPHHKKTPDDPPEEIKVPRVHMDYFFMSKEDQSASKNPMLVMVDEKSGGGMRDWLGEKA